MLPVVVAHEIAHAQLGHGFREDSWQAFVQELLAWDWALSRVPKPNKRLKQTVARILDAYLELVFEDYGPGNADTFRGAFVSLLEKHFGKESK
jgi:hypothetical protein